MDPLFKISTKQYTNERERERVMNTKVFFIKKMIYMVKAH